MGAHAHHQVRFENGNWKIKDIFVFPYPARTFPYPGVVDIGNACNSESTDTHQLRSQDERPGNTAGHGCSSGKPLRDVWFLHGMYIGTRVQARAQRHPLQARRQRRHHRRRQERGP